MEVSLIYRYILFNNIKFHLYILLKNFIRKKS